MILSVTKLKLKGPFAKAAKGEWFVNVDDIRSTCFEVLSACPPGNQPDPATRNTFCKACEENTTSPFSNLAAWEQL